MLSPVATADVELFKVQGCMKLDTGDSGDVRYMMLRLCESLLEATVVLDQAVCLLLKQ